jgi:predicted transcriptional regulator
VSRVQNSAMRVIDLSRHIQGTNVPRNQDTVHEDGIVCLIDGKKVRNLGKHLIVNFGMTPKQYRALYDLSADYPMAIARQVASYRVATPGNAMNNTRLLATPAR